MKFLDKFGGFIVFFVFSILGIINISIWESAGRYSLTGDEPHYLILASSLIEDGKIQPVAAYKREFAERRIFKTGLAAPDAEPNAANAHFFAGPNGFYSFHSIGLPVLIAAPYALFGVFGVKVFLQIFSGLGVVLLYKLVRRRFSAATSMFWVLVLTGAFPFFYSVSQIYPDAPAAVLIMAIVYFGGDFRQDRTSDRSALGLWITASAIACLPWLHNKFAIFALVMGAFLIYSILVTRKDYKSLLPFLLPTLSACILLLHNRYAYGQISGPYPYIDEMGVKISGLAFHMGTLNTVLGGFFDQSQGLFFLCPLIWIAVIFSGDFFEKKNDRNFQVIVLISSLLIVIVNGLHQNPYLGYSFVGRNFLSIFLIVNYFIIFSLKSLETYSKRIYIAAGVVAVLYLIGTAVLAHKKGVDFYNPILVPQYFGAALADLSDPQTYKDLARPQYIWTWLDSYSLLYYPIARFLPAFMSPWFPRHLPNYAFPALFLLLLVGALTASRRDRLRRSFPDRSLWRVSPLLALSQPVSIGVASGAIGLAVCLATPGVFKRLEQPYSYAGAAVPGQTGRIMRAGRIAVGGEHQPGLLAFGPAFRFRPGTYELTIDYAYDGAEAPDPAIVLVVDFLTDLNITEHPLAHTNGQTSQAIVKFKTTALLTPVGLWVKWPGGDNLRVLWFTLKRVKRS